MFRFYLSSVWCLHTVVCSPHGCLLHVWVCICFLMVAPPPPQKCLKTAFEQHSESHRLDKPSVQSDLFTTGGASRYQLGASCWCDSYHASCCEDLFCKLTKCNVNHLQSRCDFLLDLPKTPVFAFLLQGHWLVYLFVYLFILIRIPISFRHVRMIIFSQSPHTKRFGVYILKTIQIAVFQDESVRITSDCIRKV